MKRKTMMLLMALILMLAAALPAAAEETAGWEFPELGISIAMKENAEESGYVAFAEQGSLVIGYTTGEGLSMAVAMVILYPEEDFTDATEEQMNAEFEASGLRNLGAGNGYRYVLISLSNYDDPKEFLTNVLAIEESEITPELIEEMQTVKQTLSAMFDGFTIIPLVEPEPLSMGSFSTVDIYGKPVTEEILAGKDLTVINIWATFCSPCINEMPELAAWSAELPENVQLVGLVSDVYATDPDSMATAQQIVEMTGANYFHLVPSEDLVPVLMLSQYVPTTIFVDGEGKLVGEPIIGASPELYKQFVEEYINGLEK